MFGGGHFTFYQPGGGEGIEGGGFEDKNGFVGVEER